VMEGILNVYFRQQPTSREYCFQGLIQFARSLPDGHASDEKTLSGALSDNPIVRRRGSPEVVFGLEPVYRNHNG
jgi:hypothetical protein